MKNKHDTLPLSQFMGELRSMIAEFTEQTNKYKEETREIQRMASKGRFIKLQMLLRSCSENDYREVVLPYLLKHPALDYVWEDRSTVHDTRYRDLINIAYLDKRFLAKGGHITHPQKVSMATANALPEGFLTEFEKEDGYFSEVTSYQELRSQYSEAATDFYYAYAESSAIKKLERLDLHFHELDIHGYEISGLNQFIWKAHNLKELTIKHDRRDLLQNVLLRGIHHQKLETLCLQGIPSRGLSALRGALKWYGANLVELDLTIASSAKGDYFGLLDELPNLIHLDLPYVDFHSHGEAILEYANRQGRDLKLRAQSETQERW